MYNVVKVNSVLRYPQISCCLFAVYKYIGVQMMFIQYYDLKKRKEIKNSPLECPFVSTNNYMYSCYNKKSTVMDLCTAYAI